MKSKKYHPGDVVPMDGEYVVQTPMGLRVRDTQFKFPQGGLFPPIGIDGYAWILDRVLILVPDDHAE